MTELEKVQSDIETMVESMSHDWWQYVETTSPSERAAIRSGIIRSVEELAKLVTQRDALRSSSS